MARRRRRRANRDEAGDEGRSGRSSRRAAAGGDSRTSGRRASRREQRRAGQVEEGVEEEEAGTATRGRRRRRRKRAGRDEGRGRREPVERPPDRLRYYIGALVVLIVLVAVAWSPAERLFYRWRLTHEDASVRDHAADGIKAHKAKAVPALV